MVSRIAEKESTRSKINEWGNSIALRIPKSLADSLNFVKGDEIELFIDEEKKMLCVKKARESRRPRVDLMALLEQVTPKDQSPLLEPGGGPKGSEFKGD